MFKKIFFLYLTAAIALSACKTLEVRFNQTPTDTAVETLSAIPSIPPILNPTATVTPEIPHSALATISLPTAPLLVTASPPSLNLIVNYVTLYGVTDVRDQYGTLIDENTFVSLHEPQGGYSELQFVAGLPLFLIKNNISISQVASMTSGWHMYIYRYRTDNLYSNQPAIKLNDFQTRTNSYSYSLITSINRKNLQTEFGDCRVFTSQIIDEHGNLLWQGFFVLNPKEHLPPGYEVRTTGESVVFGSPYSFYQDEVVFFRKKTAFTIFEPKGGFYRLTYMFNFVMATGVTGTFEMEALASKLTLGFFRYQKDGKYSISDSYPVIGNGYGNSITLGGIYTVELPIDYMKENISGNNMYYLQIVDDKGNTIKDENFEYIPYTP